MSDSLHLVYTLKQHTPIIHFQHDQEGATLRATELKPKLDRFIMETEFGINANFEQTKAKFLSNHKTWVIGQGKSSNIALNYKISVSSIGDQKVFLPFSFLKASQRDYITQNRNEIPLDPAPYFANNQHFDNNDLNNSNWNEMKRAIMYEGAIISITCVNSSLRKRIDELFCTFISITNFGTRNNKGFGCFEVTHRNGDAFVVNKELQKEYWKKAPGLLAVFQCHTNTSDLRQLFKTINEQYQILKSGLNRPGNHPLYVKSILFQYYAKNNVKWEKRWLKHKFKSEGVMPIIKQNNLPIETDCSNQWDHSENTANSVNYRYIRSLFGLAEHNEFQKNNPPGGKPFKVNIKHLQNGDTKIERNRSPITLKVIYGNLYFLVFPPAAILYNELFSFSFKNERGIEIGHNISAPNSFDIVDFMGYATSLINDINKRMDPRPNNCRDDHSSFAQQYSRII